MRFFPFGKTIFPAAVLFVLFSFHPVPAAADDFAKLRHYGYIEYAMLTEADIKLQAKLDTGADNSSVHAPDREIFQKKGKDWVRFTIQGENGQVAEFEKPVVRIARIEQRTGPNAVRPVVMMDICIGDRKETVQVNLADRSTLKYPLLIGRSFLEKGILVNSAAQFVTEPRCTESAGL